ncbi:hypothetical protein LTR28_011489, partial [Elasticomyces elasticus]
RKRRHIATLPFEARCTAAGYGWICVGGEDEGRFAAIKLDGEGPRTLDVDSALPIDHWAQVGRPARAASVRVEMIGEEIVNSISIHRIQDEDAHLDDIVAVLTNNDKTVRVYSLPQNLETYVLDLPFAMNHATISPDGRTLVAVGDHNEAYFFSREVQREPPQIPKPHNRLSTADCDWTETAIVKLYVPGEHASLGYFTTAWSPTGRLMAVGSEAGYITVFDMDLLQTVEFGEDAIVATLPSSRPNIPSTHAGAVRSMIFSPDPWDLLIWAEDQGRVCIGDLRSHLRSRQVLELDHRAEGLNRISLEDLHAEGALSDEQEERLFEEEFVRRYRSAADNTTAINIATEYVEARRELDRQRHGPLRQHLHQVSDSVVGGNAVLDDDRHGLTADEQRVLETLRTARQREEARTRGIPRSVNYTSPSLFQNPATRGSNNANTDDDFIILPRPPSVILDDPPDAFPELSRTDRPPSSSGANRDTTDMNLPTINSIQEYLDLRARYGPQPLQDRPTWNPPQPRRRSSIVFSPSGSSAPTYNTAPPHALRASESQRDGSNGTNATMSDVLGENPWRTIEDAMTQARGALFEYAARVSPLPSTNSPAPPSLANLQSELREARAQLRSGQAPTRAELQTELAAERARLSTTRLARQGGTGNRVRSLRGEAGTYTPSFMKEHATY